MIRLVDEFNRIARERGLHGVPEVTTAREARDQAKKDLVAKHGEPEDRLAEIGLDAMAGEEVFRTGPQRREAREAAARERLLALADALIEAAVRLGWGRPEPEKAREIIGMLLGLVIVRGDGGPGDLGGPGGASALPIVTCIRSHAGWGRAWVSAFSAATRALFEEWRPWEDCHRVELNIDYCGDLVVSVRREVLVMKYWIDVGIVHPEVWRILADPNALTVTGAPLPVSVVLPAYGAVEHHGVPTNHPYHLAGAIALGRSGYVSVSDMSDR